MRSDPLTVLLSPAADAGGVDRARVLAVVVDVATTRGLDLDPPALLPALCADVAAALGTGCALLLADPAGAVRVAAASGPVVADLAAEQDGRGEGPGVDAARQGTPVVLPRLEPTGGPFAVAALRCGVGATAAWPMAGTGALQVVGRAGALTPARLAAAELLAAVLGTALADAALHRHATALAGQLSHALESRVPVEQAKGALAERHRVPPGEAFRLLRAFARRNRLPMARAAAAVLDGAAVAAVPAAAAPTVPAIPSMAPPSEPRTGSPGPGPGARPSPGAGTSRPSASR